MQRSFPSLTASLGSLGSSTQSQQCHAQLHFRAALFQCCLRYVQMLKALMPVAVFAVGCGFGTESFSVATLTNMIVVTAGVAIASYGEINFVLVGVFLQLASVATESTRLTMVAPSLNLHILLVLSTALP